MIGDRLHRTYEIPVRDWIASVPNELAVDAVGLWQIIPVGRLDFGLSGEELVDYVRQSLLGIFSRGAKPVRGVIGGSCDWVVDESYGDTPEQMTKSIISEWAASNRDPDPGGLWFALPGMYE